MRALPLLLVAAARAAADDDDDVVCTIAPRVLNETTFPLVKDDLAGILLASTCGKNRGLFVAEGAVGSCTSFPRAWAGPGVPAGAAWDANAVVVEYRRRSQNLSLKPPISLRSALFGLIL